MRSRRKRESNLRNAQASTGPQSSAGRARASQNARRHGLSVSVLTHPGYSNDVQALARTIAGDGAGSEIQEFARRIAEAQIDLMRVRQARHDLLVRHLDHPDPLPVDRKRLKLIQSVVRRRTRLGHHSRRPSPPSETEGPDKLARSQSGWPNSSLPWSAMNAEHGRAASWPSGPSMRHSASSATSLGVCLADRRARAGRDYPSHRPPLDHPSEHAGAN